MGPRRMVRVGCSWDLWSGYSLLIELLGIADPLPVQQGPHPASHQSEWRGAEPLGHPGEPTSLGQKGKCRRAGVARVGAVPISVLSWIFPLLSLAVSGLATASSNLPLCIPLDC